MKNQSTPTALKVSGYASLFGQRDLSGDIVKRGAFAASLLAQSGRRFPMLLGHDTKKPVGVWDRVTEDARGLYVEGRIFSGTKRADHALRLVMEEAVSGLSIGYRAVRHERLSAGRTLIEIDLFEISLVAFPMLRDARISHIKIITSGDSDE